MAARSLFVGFSLVLLTHFNIWRHLPDTIAADTLWHLSPVGRVLLILIVIVLVCGLSYLCIAKTELLYQRLRHWHRHKGSRIAILAISDILMTLAIFWLGLSLAPQIFYLLYITLFDYLPLQWIAKFMGLNEFLALLRIEKTDNLRTLVTSVMLQSLLISSTLIWLYSATVRRARSRQA